MPVEVDGRRESLVYLREPGELAAYEELRAGFTAAVSHELRTPLARLLALLETAALPSADVQELIEQGKAEVEQIRELIDDVLFLSELETGRAVVALTATPAAPVVREVLDELAERASRAGVTLAGRARREGARCRFVRACCGSSSRTWRRTRSATRATASTFTITVTRSADGVVITAADTGSGVAQADLPRLFERFYRADRARASRGTGLGLAIVKHIVTSAGGQVEASSRRAGPRDPDLLPGMSDSRLRHPGPDGPLRRPAALQDVSFAGRGKQVTAIIGPSGCGKSTFIRCLNRMNDVVPGAKVEGTILYNGQDLYGSGVDPIEVRKRIGMVFQRANPFPKSIYDNVAYGPRVLRMTRRPRRARGERAPAGRALGRGQGPAEAERAFASRAASSSGSASRARSRSSPDVILMDEPASALDPIATTRIEDLMHALKETTRS